MPIYHGYATSDSPYTVSSASNYSTVSASSYYSGAITSGSWGTVSYTYAPQLGPPSFYDVITGAQSKYPHKKKDQLNLMTLCQNVFGSPFLFIEKICTPLYSKDDFYKRSLSALIGHENQSFVASIEATVNEFNQLLARNIFQSATKNIRSIKDGEVIKEIMDTQPSWIIISSNLAESFGQNLNTMETYGIQYLTTVINKGFSVQIFATTTPDTDRAFVMAGNKSNIQFRYNVPFTILNGHLVSTSHFHIVDPDKIQIYLSEEFQNVNSIA